MAMPSDFAREGMHWAGRTVLHDAAAKMIGKERGRISKLGNTKFSSGLF